MFQDSYLKRECLGLKVYFLCRDFGAQAYNNKVHGPLGLEVRLEGVGTYSVNLKRSGTTPSQGCGAQTLNRKKRSKTPNPKP